MDVLEQVIDRFRWWRSLKRNQTLWAWVEDTYTPKEIRKLAAEATDCNLHETYNPLACDVFIGEEEAWRRTVRRLYRRYEEDVWAVCIETYERPGPRGSTVPKGTVGAAKLACLDLANQVSNQRELEEFMVRNAVKLTAVRILKDQGFGPEET